MSDPQILSLIRCEQSDEKLLQDFFKLHFEGNHSDTKLIAGDRTFDVHMAIIAQRCPRLLENAKHKQKPPKPKPVPVQTDTCKTCHKKIKKCKCPKQDEDEEEAEVLCNEWELTGYDDKMTNELLRYAYTGGIDGSVDYELIKTLHEKAHDLQLAELKEICLSVLGNYIAIENCVDMLVFADKMECHELKEQAQNYVLDNSREIVNRGFLGLLVQKKPELLEILFEKLVERSSNQQDILKGYMHHHKESNTTPEAENNGETTADNEEQAENNEETTEDDEKQAENNEETTEDIEVEDAVDDISPLQETDDE